MLTLIWATRVLGQLAPQRRVGDGLARVLREHLPNVPTIAVTATATDRVHRFLANAGVLEAQKRNNPEKAKPKKKAQERAAANAPKVEAPAEAAAPAPAAAPCSRSRMPEKP